MFCCTSVLREACNTVIPFAFEALFFTVHSLKDAVGFVLLPLHFSAQQFWFMAMRLRKFWQDWRSAKRRKKALLYWQKRSEILQQGLPIYADVLDCYTSRISTAQLTLVYLKLSIPVKGDVSVEAVSTAFVACESRTLISKRLRIRFLPGDLSHVVIAG